ncbi:MAG: lipoate--protein ligase [Halobacteriovoraceae bacterium]|jgi:lipoate---protein ligase|nr:lipoate--protein ligase [Halobacteriovoraceae bacterium]
MNISKIFKSSLTNPYQNLAIENYLLNQIKPKEKFLFLYVNEPSIVLGRFQNPWLECDLERIKRDGVHLVRRQSGGGTVYHDLKNLNFSFIVGDREFDKDLNNQILCRTLKSLGVDAYSSGRSDILVNFEGIKKVSGSAFKQKKDRSFHHGTMLIDSDLTKLNNYLMSKQSIMGSKSIASVRSQVLNLKQLNPKINISQFVDGILDDLSTNLGERLIFEQIGDELIDSEHFHHLGSWEWQFGETPFFIMAIEIEGLQVELEAKKGKIIKIDLLSDVYNIYLLQSLEDELLNMSLQVKSIGRVFTTMFEKHYDFETELTKLKELMLKLNLFH